MREKGKRYNDAGEYLGETKKVELADPSFGPGTYKGLYPDVDWDGFRKPYADKEGFDVRAKNSNDEYKYSYILKEGEIIIRYGSPRGTYSAPEGTPYDLLGLPYKRETMEFHVYRVKVKTLEVLREVTKGTVAPYFLSKGGAIQYKHILPIGALLNNETLEEVLE